MRLTLRNLLEWLDQTGWENATLERLGEIIRQPQRAHEWIKRLQRLRQDSNIRSLDNRSELEAADPNRLAKYLDRELDDHATIAFEKNVLHNDQLLRDLIRCHLAAHRAANSGANGVSLSLRQHIYNLAKPDQQNDKGERIKRFAGDLPFVDRELSSGKDDKSMEAPPVTKSEAENSASSDLGDPGATESGLENHDGKVTLAPPKPMAVSSRRRWLPVVLTIALFGIGVASFYSGWWFANQRNVVAKNSGSADSDLESQKANGDTTSQGAAGDDGNDQTDNDTTDGDGSNDGQDEVMQLPSDDETDNSDEWVEEENSPPPPPPMDDEEDKGEDTNDNLADNDADDSDSQTNEEEMEADSNAGEDVAENDIKPLGSEVGRVTSSKQLLAFFGNELDPAPPKSAELKADGRLKITQVQFRFPGLNNNEVNQDDEEDKQDKKNDDQGEIQDLVNEAEEKQGNDDKKVNDQENSESNRQWVLCVDGQPIHENQKVLALVGFRPEITFTESCAVELVGPASVEIGPLVDTNPTVILEWGQLLAKSKKAFQKIQLNAGEITGELEFSEDNTTVAIESYKFNSPGSDPTKDSPQDVFQLIVLEGSCTWKVGDRSFELKQREALVLDQNKSWITGQYEFAPNWVVVSNRDRLTTAASGMSQEVETGKALTEQLVGLTDDRRSEVRALAMQNLCAIGDFQFVIDFFGAVRNKNNWGYLLDQVRFVLNQRPELQVKLDQALDVTGKRKAEYKLLIRGFSQAQLDSKIDEAEESSTQAERLVSMLDDDQLAIRVLAIENLRRIMGGATYLYRPDVEGSRRRDKIRRWRLLEIKYSEMPKPDLLELKSPSVDAEQDGEDPEATSDKEAPDKGASDEDSSDGDAQAENIKEETSENENDESLEEEDQSPDEEQDGQLSDALTKISLAILG